MRCAALLVVAAALTAASACVAFMEQAPCQRDGNCRSGQRCDLETHTCVPRDALSDAGSGGEDGAVGDAAGLDLSRPDGALPDTLRPDSARPDTTQPDTFIPCTDNDGDDYGDHCPLGGDCDDTDPTIYPSSFCDDGVAATVADVCLPDGTCSGFYRPGAGDCAMSCSGCAQESCCIEACGPQGCPTCPDGCVCAFSFDRNQSATGTCAPGSVCHLWVQGGDNATLTCNGASCYLYCEGNSGNCTLDCNGGAYCVLRCDPGVASCNMNGCSAGAMTCPSGVIVCDRVCPIDL